MARTSTYLNFPNNTEEVFNFYKTIFGGEFTGNGIMRFGDMPPMEGMPPTPDALKNLVVHVELSITAQVQCSRCLGQICLQLSVRSLVRPLLISLDEFKSCLVSARTGITTPR